MFLNKDEVKHILEAGMIYIIPSLTDFDILY